VVVGAVGDGRRDGAPPGQPSRITGPKPGGRAAGGGGGGRNGPPVPLPPRCCAIPPAPLPGWADSDDGDHGARTAAHSNAGDGDPLGNNKAAAAVASKADDMGQENDDHGGNNGDNDEDDDKWGREA
jgi:hypothetical protein